ncbi:hypothetical protein KPL71_020582 [Citrus sinensis]|uniref:Uncharacterized protein n=1 Tax=Citrus sinensis TaxID=2711 RepID=A0ACB8JBC6_CITSI|nr:hypothetical protein KPL71_020582 [Citrus sinensis]
MTLRERICFNFFSSLTAEEVQQEARLVRGARKEAKRLTNNFEASQARLSDAEQRQGKEKRVRLWLYRIKDESYEMEEVLDEGSTARLKLRIEEGAEDENAGVVPQKKECFFITSTCFRSKQGSLPLDIALKIKGVNENLVVSRKTTTALVPGLTLMFKEVQNRELANVAAVSVGNRFGFRIEAQRETELKEKKLRVGNAINATSKVIVAGGACILGLLVVKVDGIRDTLDNDGYLQNGIDLGKVWKSSGYMLKPIALELSKRDGVGVSLRKAKSSWACLLK